MVLPLEGLKVVAIEQAVAAPYATSRLADAGATVTKVERPEGDFARGYDDVAKGQSSYFVWLNRGKDSITLDLGSDTGKEKLAQLIANADVLIQNLKPAPWPALVLIRTGWWWIIRASLPAPSAVSAKPGRWPTARPMIC